MSNGSFLLAPGGQAIYGSAAHPQIYAAYPPRSLRAYRDSNVTGIWGRPPVVCTDLRQYAPSHIPAKLLSLKTGPFNILFGQVYLTPSSVVIGHSCIAQRRCQPWRTRALPRGLGAFRRLDAKWRARQHFVSPHDINENKSFSMHLEYQVQHGINK